MPFETTDTALISDRLYNKIQGVVIQEKIHPESKPIRNPAFALQEDENGWTALVNLDTPAGIALNTTGFLVWQKIDGVRTVAEIFAEIKEHFFDAPPTIEEDLLAILEVLQEAGLIGFEVEI